MFAKPGSVVHRKGMCVLHGYTDTNAYRSEQRGKFLQTVISYSNQIEQVSQDNLNGK